MRILVVGGRQEGGPVTPGQSARYRCGKILELDTRTGELETRLRYRSPPSVVPHTEPSVLFKVATLVDDTLYVCTETEVLAYSLPEFRPILHVSHPWLNDCHHVRVSPRGTLYVLSTGLDLVLEMTDEGEVVREWSVIDDDPWSRFDRDVDYRKVRSTKPHGAHANFLFSHRSELWVTRCNQRDVRRITGPAETVALDEGKPHDGVVHGDRFYFTTVNGRIVVVDLERRRVERVIDLQSCFPAVRAPGWCRGIAILSEKEALVGFGRIRPTRWSENLRDFASWDNLRRHGTAPTRVACFDLEAEELSWEREVEEEGLDAIFSIHVLEPELIPATVTAPEEEAERA